MSTMVASKWTDLGIRAASALVLAPIVLFIVWQGGVWFQTLVGFMGVMMAREWTDIAHAGEHKQFALHALAALCGIFIFRDWGMGLAMMTIAAIVFVSVVLVMLSTRDKTVWTMMGVPYVALPPLAIMVLRDDAQWGLASIVWCVGIVWAADILAYFTGRIIGGPKLAPVLSPKKTWAGFGGALLGAAAAAAIFAQVMHLGHWPLIGFAAVAAAVEQGGDIFESALKRHYAVKDSGSLIPGHGGLLDRVDGLIAVVVLAAIVGLLHNSHNVSEGLLRW
jgi:phosphatidate cytidylyltransferase